MRYSISRRDFALSVTSCASLAPIVALHWDDQEQAKKQPPSKGPVEAPFERDYEPPQFNPSCKNPQINRQMVQDFVIYAHMDLEMVKKLYDKNPALLNGAIDWGGGDWETALGGASHMGRKDIVQFLLSKGARLDIFCAAMMGMSATVKEMLTVEPALIHAKGPHGFTLEFHATRGGDDSKELLEFLKSQ